MATMKAARIHSFGGPDVLRIEELTVPSIGEHEVLIRVHAASVNPVDYKIRSGAFPVPREQLPKVLGRDIAGTIERCGARVHAWQPGDEVFALLDAAHGGYAEYVALAAELCARKPRNLSFVEAAAVPLAALTAWQALFDHGRLEPGQTVVVEGAAGGVGHFAIQLAKAKGARVIAVVRDRDVEFVRDLGADEAFTSAEALLERHVRDVDLVCDLVGGELRDRSFSVLRPGAALISTLGQPDQDKARHFRVRAEGFLVHPNAAALGEVATLIEQGKVRPQIQSVFALGEARDAQLQAERTHTQGKIVLDIMP